MHATLNRKKTGSLMYLKKTRPNICFVVNTFIQYMVQLRQVHLVAAKHVMRYLKGTVEYGLRFNADYEFNLQGFTDSNWAENVKDRKSTSGCCFSLGSAMISWFNRKQTSVALSTAEEEYIAACLACAEGVWL